MKLAVLAIEKRGPDATGIAWTQQSGKTWYWKTPKTARQAIRDIGLHADMTTAIGHARWATQGDVKDNRNNHPVIEDGIMLVHNGVIDNDRDIFRLFGDEYVPKADVDTQVAAALLANPDVVYATHPTELLSLIEGTAAFGWIDTDSPHTLHLARCAGRPMTIGWTRKGDLVMSSTPETLNDLAMWSNIRISKVREIDEGTYLRVIGGEIVEESTFTVKKAKKVYGWKSPYGKGKTTTTKTSPTTSKVTTVIEPAGSTIVDPFDDDDGWEFQDPDWALDLPARTGVVDDEIDDDAWWDEREEEVIARLVAIHSSIDRQTLWELGELYDLASSPWLPDGSDIDWDHLTPWHN